MEIQPKRTFPQIRGSYDAAASGVRSSAGSPSHLSFDAARSLDENLAATPEMRPEKVELGKQLIASEEYPPAETIAKIVRLLAANI